MCLDNKLNFGKHFKYIANKINKVIGLLRKLQKLLRPLVTSSKYFIKQHNVYGYIILD